MNLKSRNKIDPSFSMSSMTDIVFLLLIFFLLTSTMVPQNALKLQLPKANGDSTQSNSLVVSIDNDGVYYLSGQVIPKTELEQSLINNIQQLNDKSFVLQAEENTLTKDLVFVMDIAKRNEYQMVLATEPQD